MAIASFIIGIIGLFLVCLFGALPYISPYFVIISWMGIFGWIFVLLGIIFATIAIAKNERRGLGVTGLIINLVTGGLIIFFTFAGINMVGDISNDIKSTIEKHVPNDSLQVDNDSVNPADSIALNDNFIKESLTLPDSLAQ